MNKTLSILAFLALASAASAATITDTYTLSNFSAATAEGYTYGTLSLGYTLNNTADWEISARFTLGANAFNSYGTTAISTNSNAFTSNTGVRVYRVAGDEKPLHTDWFGEGKDNSILSGTMPGDIITMTLTFNMVAGEVAIAYSLDRPSVGLYNYTGEGYSTTDAAVIDNLAISALSTSIGYGNATDWTLNQLSVTHEESTPAIPEPATATLSLLALAGVAIRRRRS